MFLWCQAQMATPVLVMQGLPPLACHLLQKQPYHFFSLSPSLGSHAQGEMAPGVMEVNICLTPGSCTLPSPLLLPGRVSATHAAGVTLRLVQAHCLFSTLAASPKSSYSQFYPGSYHSPPQSYPGPWRQMTWGPVAPLGPK